MSNKMPNWMKKELEDKEECTHCDGIGKIERPLSCGCCSEPEECLICKGAGEIPKD